MIKHVIIWTLKEEYSDAEKAQIKADMKASLEALKGVIPGLIDIKLYTEPLSSSKNADVLLDTTFESEEALKNYSIHPLHVEVATTKVRPFISHRCCMDYEI